MIINAISLVSEPRFRVPLYASGADYVQLRFYPN